MRPAGCLAPHLTTSIFTFAYKQHGKEGGHSSTLMSSGYFASGFLIFLSCIVIKINKLLLYILKFSLDPKFIFFPSDYQIKYLPGLQSYFGL